MGKYVVGRKIFVDIAFRRRNTLSIESDEAQSIIT